MNFKDVCADGLMNCWGMERISNSRCRSISVLYFILCSPHFCGKLLSIHFAHPNFWGFTNDGNTKAMTTQNLSMFCWLITTSVGVGFNCCHVKPRVFHQVSCSFHFVSSYPGGFFISGSGQHSVDLWPLLCSQLLNISSTVYEVMVEPLCSTYWLQHSVCVQWVRKDDTVCPDFVDYLDVCSMAMVKWAK